MNVSNRCVHFSVPCSEVEFFSRAWHFSSSGKRGILSASGSKGRGNAVLPNLVKAISMEAEKSAYVRALLGATWGRFAVAHRAKDLSHREISARTRLLSSTEQPTDPCEIWPPREWKKHAFRAMQEQWKVGLSSNFQSAVIKAIGRADDNVIGIAFTIASWARGSPKVPVEPQLGFRGPPSAKLFLSSKAADGGTIVGVFCKQSVDSEEYSTDDGSFYGPHVAHNVLLCQQSRNWRAMKETRLPDDEFDSLREAVSANIYSAGHAIYWCAMEGGDETYVLGVANKKTKKIIACVSATWTLKDEGVTGLDLVVIVPTADLTSFVDHDVTPPKPSAEAILTAYLIAQTMLRNPNGEWLANVRVHAASSGKGDIVDLSVENDLYAVVRWIREMKRGEFLGALTSSTCQANVETHRLKVDSIISKIVGIGYGPKVPLGSVIETAHNAAIHFLRSLGAHDMFAAWKDLKSPIFSDVGYEREEAASIAFDLAESCSPKSEAFLPSVRLCVLQMAIFGFNWATVKNKQEALWRKAKSMPAPLSKRITQKEWIHYQLWVFHVLQVTETKKPEKYKNDRAVGTVAGCFDVNPIDFADAMVKFWKEVGTDANTVMKLYKQLACTPLRCKKIEELEDLSKVDGTLQACMCKCVCAADCACDVGRRCKEWTWREDGWECSSRRRVRNAVQEAVYYLRKPEAKETGAREDSSNVFRALEIVIGSFLPHEEIRNLSSGHLTKVHERAWKEEHDCPEKSQMLNILDSIWECLAQHISPSESVLFDFSLYACEKLNHEFLAKQSGVTVNRGREKKCATCGEFYKNLEQIRCHFSACQEVVSYRGEGGSHFNAKGYFGEKLACWKHFGTLNKPKPLQNGEIPEGAFGTEKWARLCKCVSQAIVPLGFELSGCKLGKVGKRQERILSRHRFVRKFGDGTQQFLSLCPGKKRKRGEETRRQLDAQAPGALRAVRREPLTAQGFFCQTCSTVIACMPRNAEKPECIFCSGSSRNLNTINVDAEAETDEDEDMEI